MSYQVKIDYEGEAIKCCSICKMARNTITDIDKMLAKVKNNSSLLLNEESALLEKELQFEKNCILKQIKEVEFLAEEQKTKGVIYQSDGDVKSSQKIVIKAQDLMKECNLLNSEKLFKYSAFLDDLLDKEIKERQNYIESRSSGTIHYDKKIAEELKNIKDEVLKNYIYLELFDNKNIGKSFQEIKEIAINKLNIGLENTVSKNIVSIKNNIHSQLKSLNIEDKRIEEIVNTKEVNFESVKKMQLQVNNEIVDEHIRKETLKSIIKTIEKRGFIVDRKNIKLQKDKNQVVCFAQKISGETAEFQIFLDGKFIYKFEGYEGHACQKDITPFIEDLENVYGIKIKHSETIWSNPDKKSTMKYQAMNVNKNND